MKDRYLNRYLDQVKGSVSGKILSAADLPVIIIIIIIIIITTITITIIIIIIILYLTTCHLGAESSFKRERETNYKY